MTSRGKRAQKPGMTSLLGEEAVSKDDPRLRAIGAIDEASASLSLAKAFLTDPADKDILSACQEHLSLIMAGMAGWNHTSFQEKLAFALEKLESFTAEVEKKTEMPGAFLHPGKTPAEGALDLARAVVRRAERETISLAKSPQGNYIPEAALNYVNRLSYLCFLLLAGQAAGSQNQ